MNHMDILPVGERAVAAKRPLLCQFGLMTDNYKPKPAFHVYRELIGALSR